MINKVIQSDCIAGISSVEDGSVDIIISDPPYNINKNFGNNKTNLSLEDYIKWSIQWVEECIRVLKPNGTMYIYGYAENLAYISTKININKKWLVWHYTNKTVPSLNFWQRSHENILMCWKDSYVFNRDEVREPYTENFLKNSAGKIRTGTEGRFGNNKDTTYKAHEKGALPRDVLKASTLAGGSGSKNRIGFCKTCSSIVMGKDKINHKNHHLIHHPTQKPFEISEKLIKASKPNKSGLVLIPFTGSGSECFVARKLGLDFIGFDLNQDYVDMANKLLETLNND